jgi:serine/threonine protein kinase
MSEQNALTIGTVIEDRYRLISEGNPQDLGMAYTAYDLQGDQLVNLLVMAVRWGSGQEALNRLQLVEESVTDLSAPGLIPYEHTGLVDGQLYLVHPHIEGQTLADILARSARLDAKTAVDITIRLCEALAPVHHAGLAHGSLSPHCVMVKETAAADDPSAAEILVLDTGLLPALRPPDASIHRPWGRLPYISPEQASGQSVQPGSDVYVIGAILYEMLIGRPPFRAADEAVVVLQHLHQEPPSLQIMDTSIPRPLAQIVYNALAKEPSARYRNAGQLAHILRAQVRPQPKPVQPTPKEHLVVPPPPAPVVGDTWSSTDLYDLEGAGAWEQEQESVDWLMIALLIAALIAVLGLIPLWRAVYGRYVGTSASAFSVPHPPEAEPAPILLGDNCQGCQPDRGAELDEWAVVWYNTMTSRSSLADLHTKSMHTRHLSGYREKAPSLGVQLTGQGKKV